MKQYPWYPAEYYDTLADFAKGVGEKYGDSTAIVSYTRAGKEQKYAYREIAERSFALARALAARGVVRKRIAILGENSFEYLIAFLAIGMTGGVAVAVDTEQSDDSVKDMLTRADAEYAFVSAAMRSLCEANIEAEKLFSLDSLSVAKLTDEADGSEQLPQTDPLAPCLIIYTSGTTSASKPVLLSQRAILYNAAKCVQVIKPENRIFTSLPMYHAYGLTSSVLSNLLNGVTVGLNGNLKTLVRDLRLFNGGSMMAVPLLVESLSKGLWAEIEKKGKKEQVSRLVRLTVLLNRMGIPFRPKILGKIKEMAFGNMKSIACGGAHIHLSLIEEMRAFGILVLEGYGVTECAPLISVNRNEYYRFSTAGTALPGIDIRIEPDGEICVRGDCLMSGYYNDEADTAAAIRDGWFHTGDLGKLDRRGFLSITGRKKNLIVLKNGKKISPEEVEMAFSGVPLIKEIVAYGAASGVSADDVRLAIMVYPDPEISKNMSRYDILEKLQEEVDAFNARMPLFKQIQMINIREREFDKTSSRKVKRQTL